MNLLIDNSALSLLHCKRLFQLVVIQGLKIMEDEGVKTGSAGHTLVEHLEKGDSVDTAIDAMLEKHGENIRQDKILMAATMYRGSTRLPAAIMINGALAIEYKFRYKYGEIIHNGEKITVELCGTMDKIYLDQKEDQLVIVDMKWSAAVTPSHRESITSATDLAFQLPFYAHALLNIPDFPEEYREYIRTKRYRVELHYIFFNTDPVLTKKERRSAFSDSFLLAEVPTIINHKIEEVLKVAQLKDSAIHDGMLVYGACKRCVFKPACIDMGTEREVEYLTRFPRRIYDPMTFR